MVGPLRALIYQVVEHPEPCLEEFFLVSGWILPTYSNPEPGWRVYSPSSGWAVQSLVEGVPFSSGWTTLTQSLVEGMFPSSSGCARLYIKADITQSLDVFC